MIERLCADVYIAIEIRGEENFFGYFVCASISFTGVAFWQTLQRLLLLCSFRYFDLLLFIWALRTKTRKRSGGHKGQIALAILPSQRLCIILMNGPQHRRPQGDSL